MLAKKFETVYHDELRELYDSEWQIIAAMPQMIEAASSSDLKTAFEDHLEETKEQLKRLERIFAELNESPGGKRSQGMSGILASGRMMNQLPASPVRDAALIAAAQKVEHFEISGYGTARTLAEMLNHTKAAALLQQTLDEEKEADAILAEIAENVLAGKVLDEAD